MSKKPPERPEHCPRDHEWLPDAYKRDVEPHGPEARDRVRQALAEGDIIAKLRTRSGERHEIDRRMWDKEPVAKKVYPRFKDGWMRMGLQLRTGLYTGHYVAGFVFVPQESLSEEVHDQSPVRPTTKAQRECARWITELASQGHMPGNKESLWEEANKKWGGRLSRRGFDRAWASAAPEDWKRSGRKSTH